jgi:glutathione S-transferase
MASLSDPEIVLYDFKHAKGDTCSSPIVWPIRVMLNYKRIPYKSIFLDVVDIEPTLKALGMVPFEPEQDSRFTVPAIHHVPTNTYLMDSVPISHFLEETYPDPPAPVTRTELGTQVIIGALTQVMPLLMPLIEGPKWRAATPSAQSRYRDVWEAKAGKGSYDAILEIDPAKEEETWEKMDAGLKAVGGMMTKNAAEGPYIEGSKPTYTDFFVAGTMCYLKSIDEKAFNRLMAYPGWRNVYTACKPFTERAD